MRSRGARAAIACARRQRRSHARQRQCEWLSVNGRWCLDRCLRRRPLPRRALIAPKRVGGGCMRVLYVRVVDPVWAVPASSPKRLRGVSGRAGGLVWRRRDLGPQSPAHRGNVVVVAVSEEASVGGGLLGRPPLMPASQAESGDGKHRGS